ncbi:MAG: antibiotic biosynthesis monooxygenase [Xanthomonadales bacterium]|nr:antibiotic biosynthesis monooxygenase [Xanthomonadales bacterium]
MYVVIFKATIVEFDDEYVQLAGHLRDLALSKYGCQEFSAVTEGNVEIAISYWQTLEQIHAWKNDPEHRVAQKKGREKWYKSYSVEVCEIVRSR